MPVRCRIYPNPFNSIATLRIEGVDEINDFSISIFNLYGQEVSHIGQINSARVILSPEGLTAGLYVYQLSGSDGKLVFTGKFIVN
jgi:hypothetical protein